MKEKPAFCCGRKSPAQSPQQGAMQAGDEAQKFHSVLELLRLLRSKAGP